MSTHLSWRRLRRRRMAAPEARAGYETARSSFWDDLNQRLEDPEFRQGYVEWSLRIQAIDEERNSAASPDPPTPVRTRWYRRRRARQ